MPSHYLNQWWNIVNWTLRNKLQWNINWNSYILIHENAFEIVWKMVTILSRPQCAKQLRGTLIHADFSHALSAMGSGLLDNYYDSAFLKLTYSESWITFSTGHMCGVNLTCLSVICYDRASRIGDQLLSEPSMAYSRYACRSPSTIPFPPNSMENISIKWTDDNSQPVLACLHNTPISSSSSCRVSWKHLTYRRLFRNESALFKMRSTAVVIV